MGFEHLQWKLHVPPHAKAWLYELLDYKCSDEAILKQIDIQDYRVQPIPDSCALVPCEGRSVPFCIVGSTRALSEARTQVWEYWQKRAQTSGWHVNEKDGSASWNDVPAYWARSVPADSRGLSSNGWTLFWHWSIGKWLWNDRTGECALVNSKRASKQRVKTFIPPWILLSYELPLLWGLHDDDL